MKVCLLSNLKETVSNKICNWARGPKKKLSLQLHLHTSVAITGAFNMQ